VVGIDHATATVRVGDESMLDVDTMRVGDMVWSHEPSEGEVRVQCSAHGATNVATASVIDGEVHLRWHTPQRRVAPGQSVVFYDPTNTFVLGGAVAARRSTSSAHR
jgi:tRNA-specific 2-thiouridylase